MSNPKKYYWLKLKNDFFDREEIKLIEAMPNGKDYIIFYMKLLLKSIENEGKLYFRGTIPYSPEMLASITTTNIDTVRVSVDMFISLGMMDKFSDGTLFMIETQNMIGSETKWAEIKRVQREKKEIGQCPNLSKKSPIEKEKEKDIDIEPCRDQGSDLKPKVKLNLSVKAAEFRQKLINSGYVGRLAPVMVEGEREDVYINEQGLLYTKTRTPKQIVSSTLNEIWEQLSEINESRAYKTTHDPLKNLKINKIGA